MSLLDSNNINKRKNAYNHYSYNTNSLNSKNLPVNKDEINYKIKSDYINNTNNNTIYLRNNHIYFNSIVDEDSIKTLIMFINNVIANNNLFDMNNINKIFLHINCKGGYIYYLFPYIELLEVMKKKIEFISIIENECNNCGIMLAALCNFRIINKNATCKLTSYNIEDNNSKLYFWEYFKQCNDSTDEINNIRFIIYNIFCNVIQCNLTEEKLKIYLKKDNILTSKKYKKLGLADEII